MKTFLMYVKRFFSSPWKYFKEGLSKLFDRFKSADQLCNEVVNDSSVKASLDAFVQTPKGQEMMQKIRAKALARSTAK